MAVYNDIREMKGMEMVRKQTYITHAQDRAVKRLARQRGTTEAEVLRQALDVFLQKYGGEEKGDPFSGMIGVFDGPVEVDHDDIYR